MKVPQPTQFVSTTNNLAPLAKPDPAAVNATNSSDEEPTLVAQVFLDLGQGGVADRREHAD